MKLEQLKERADKLFADRGQLVTLWQNLAENFYPQRADFTTKRSIGEELGSDLMTSYPVIACRELSNTFSGMLRPKNKEWFQVSINHEESLDHDGRLWLERATKIQRRAVYDPVAQFVRATKEGDHDFAGFGQCVISTELNRDRTALLHRCWHLRDVAWLEDSEGKICMVARKWRPYAIDLVQQFPKTASAALKKKAEKTPYEQVDVMHIVCAGSHYVEDEKLGRFPFVSTFIECSKCELLEQVGQKINMYVIPRWQTVSGSQYAYSPATVVALADARMLQSMTAILLEAGEKAVNPPMTARENVLRSDVAIFAGGITYVDQEFDERSGRALELLTNDKSGLPLGLQMQQDMRIQLASAFFLDKVRAPRADKVMTAFEYGQLMEQYIRDALPLFEPMEVEYNGRLMENDFELLLNNGAFGPLDQMPESLSGAETQFKFKNPLQEALDSQKATILQQGRIIVAEGIALDPSVGTIVNVKKSVRDALKGIGTPEDWLRSEDEVQAIEQAEAQRQQQAQLLASLQQGADIAETASKANLQLKEAA